MELVVRGNVSGSVFGVLQDAVAESKRENTWLATGSGLTLIISRFTSIERAVGAYRLDITLGNGHRSIDDSELELTGKRRDGT